MLESRSGFSEVWGGLRETFTPMFSIIMDASTLTPLITKHIGLPRGALPRRSSLLLVPQVCEDNTNTEQVTKADLVGHHRSTDYCSQILLAENCVNKEQFPRTQT